MAANSQSMPHLLCLELATLSPPSNHRGQSGGRLRGRRAPIVFETDNIPGTQRAKFAPQDVRRGADTVGRADCGGRDVWIIRWWRLFRTPFGIFNFIPLPISFNVFVFLPQVETSILCQALNVNCILPLSTRIDCNGQRPPIQNWGV